MSIEQRLYARERSMNRWRLICTALALALVSTLLVGFNQAEKVIEGRSEFETIVCKELILLDQKGKIAGYLTCPKEGQPQMILGRINDRYISIGIEEASAEVSLHAKGKNLSSLVANDLGGSALIKDVEGKATWIRGPKTSIVQIPQ